MELWLSFILASTVILIIPGPTIILVVSQSVAHGRQSTVPLVAGVLLGDFTAMTLSLAGLGTLLLTFTALFTLCKWLGALYLLYLGVRMWRTPPAEPVATAGSSSAKALFKCSYIVTALNPKGIAFFVAFLPQFIRPTEPLLPQLLLLGATFLVLATLNAALYAVFAGQISNHLRSQRSRHWLNRLGGSALIAAGLLTASVQRTT
ncbi:MAG: LysE family translocator [Desulfopila sp.]